LRKGTTSQSACAQTLICETSRQGTTFSRADQPFIFVIPSGFSREESALSFHRKFLSREK
jgi:hypothetical protein